MLGMISWSIEVESLPANAYRDTRGPGELAIQRMLEQLRETPKGVRDAAIVRLLHDMALRRGEVCSLDRAHFDPDRHALFVLGKKRLERVWLTMPPATQRALEAWIEVRGDEPGPMFTALDNVNLGHRLTGEGVRVTIRKLGMSVGVVTRPHGLRHTAITGALDKSDGNMRKAQQFSRHKDVRTLGKYDDNRRDFGGEMAALVALPEREGPAPALQKRAPKPKVHWALAFAQFIGAQRVALRPEQAGDGTLERFLAQYRGDREAARVEVSEPSSRTTGRGTRRHDRPLPRLLRRRPRRRGLVVRGCSRERAQRAHRVQLRQLVLRPRLPALRRARARGRSTRAARRAPFAVAERAGGAADQAGREAQAAPTCASSGEAVASTA